MKFTFNRPTKPGDYWLSIHPDKRPSAQRSDAVFPAVVPFVLYGGGQGSYREGGSMLDLSDPWFDCAQWMPRETPADPFAPPEQPTMNCPRCKKKFEDFDGVGVVYCDPKVGGCGFCRHVARSGGVCDLCGDKEQPKISDICPACSNSTDVPEGGSGDELNCTSCGAFLVIEEYTDGTFGLEPADSEDEDAAGAAVLAGE